MEIIEVGNKKNAWSMIIKCTGKGNEDDNAEKHKFPCGAKLKINADDIFMTHHYCFDGSVDDYYTIKCPCCGCLTDINKDRLPYDVQAYVEHNNNKNEDILEK